MNQITTSQHTAPISLAPAALPAERDAQLAEIDQLARRYRSLMGDCHAARLAGDDFLADGLHKLAEAVHLRQGAIFALCYPAPVVA